MPVIADAAVAAVDATDGGDFLADLVDAEGMWEMELGRGEAEIFVELGEGAAHEAFEAERVVDRDGASLPIEELVHVEDVHVPPTDALAIAEGGEDRVVSDRSDGRINRVGCPCWLRVRMRSAMERAK